MTHEYKHKVDLSQFDGITPQPWVHRETEGGVSFIEYAEGTPLFEAHDSGLYDCRLVEKAPNLLAYARELEARIEKMQKAGNHIMELLWAYTPNEVEAIEAWRNA